MASRQTGVQYSLLRPKQVAIPILKLNLNKEKTYGQGLLEGIAYAIALHQKKNATFVEKKGNLYIEIEGLTIQIRYEIDLFILNEIFIWNEYQLSYPKPYALIDIGMNVGLVSLYFARLAQCQRVFGFEPIESTFRAAQQNFDLNSHLKHKINAQNIGLGKDKKSLTFYLDQTKHGNTSSIQARSDRQSKNAVTAAILPSKATIHSILEKEAIQDFIVKIDCEGMEFEIFESLGDQIPSKIKGFMIEWHFKSPQPIIDILEKNHFKIINNSRYEQVGMIYAFRD